MKALELMPPLHGDCDDEAKDCLFPVEIKSIKISSKEKKEITGFCPICKKRVIFGVIFEK
jgi:hypothetical protein